MSAGAERDLPQSTKRPVQPQDFQEPRNHSRQNPRRRRFLHLLCAAGLTLVAATCGPTDQETNSTPVKPTAAGNFNPDLTSTATVGPTETPTPESFTHPSHLSRQKNLDALFADSNVRVIEVREDYNPDNPNRYQRTIEGRLTQGSYLVLIDKNSAATAEFPLDGISYLVNEQGISIATVKEIPKLLEVINHQTDDEYINLTFILSSKIMEAFQGKNGLVTPQVERNGQLVIVSFASADYPDCGDVLVRQGSITYDIEEKTATEFPGPQIPINPKENAKDVIGTIKNEAC